MDWVLDPTRQKRSYPRKACYWAWLSYEKKLGGVKYGTWAHWRGICPAGGRDRLWDTIWQVTRNYETIYLWLTKDRANKDLNNKGLELSIMRILSLRQTFMVFDLWIMLSAHRETLSPPSGTHLRDKFHSICLYSNSKWFWTWFDIKWNYLSLFDQFPLDFVYWTKHMPRFLSRILCSKKSSFGPSRRSSKSLSSHKISRNIFSRLKIVLLSDL